MTEETEEMKESQRSTLTSDAAKIGARLAANAEADSLNMDFQELQDKVAAHDAATKELQAESMTMLEKLKKTM